MYNSVPDTHWDWNLILLNCHNNKSVSSLALQLLDILNYTTQLSKHCAICMFVPTATSWYSYTLFISIANTSCGRTWKTLSSWTDALLLIFLMYLSLEYPIDFTIRSGLLCYLNLLISSRCYILCSSVMLCTVYTRQTII